MVTCLRQWVERLQEIPQAEGQRLTLGTYANESTVLAHTFVIFSAWRLRSSQQAALLQTIKI